MGGIVGKAARQFFLDASLPPNWSTNRPCIFDDGTRLIWRMVHQQSIRDMRDRVPGRNNLQILDRWVFDAGDEALRAPRPNRHLQGPNGPLHHGLVTCQFAAQRIFAELFPSAGAKRSADGGKCHHHSRHDRRGQHVRSKGDIPIATGRKPDGLVGSDLAIVNPVADAPDGIERPGFEVRTSIRVWREHERCTL